MATQKKLFGADAPTFSTAEDAKRQIAQFTYNKTSGNTQLTLKSLEALIELARNINKKMLRWSELKFQLITSPADIDTASVIALQGQLAATREFCTALMGTTFRGRSRGRKFFCGRGSNASSSSSDFPTFLRTKQIFEQGWGRNGIAERMNKTLIKKHVPCCCTRSY